MPSQPPIENKGIMFPESRLAHQLLDGLAGIEIGPAAHNAFGLNTRAVGLNRERDAHDFDYYEQMQLENCGRVAPIDLPGDAAAIPLPEASSDFVLHSHVWEHLPNPLVALDEWVRVLKRDGFIFAIVPKRDADPLDRDRPLTPLTELVRHYEKRSAYEDRIAEMNGPARGHYTVFSPELLHGIGDWFNRAHFWARLDEVAFQETDDKVGNGHTIVWQVRKFSGASGFAGALGSRLSRKS
ncbi:MAG: class I SAM-dependent methyltransferase [Chthoniobacterales bacterium]|nr:class I SAM-dependent methyltransferase [Chthoniobacterales bacterium]